MKKPIFKPNPDTNKLVKEFVDTYEPVENMPKWVIPSAMLLVFILSMLCA